MFWDMWKNLTSVTTNWTFGGGGNASGCKGGCGHGSSISKGLSKPTKYNRLESYSGPVKSRSHPANLITLATAEAAASLSSSSQSSASSLESITTSSSPVTNQGTKQWNSERVEVNPGKGKNGISSSSRSRWTAKSLRHSLSSTFSFTSSSLSSSNKVTMECASSNDILTNSCAPSIYSDKHPVTPTTIASHVLNNNNAEANTANDQEFTWNSAKKSDTVLDLSGQIADEDDDDDDNHLTCEVCDRAFPTPRKLAEHQRKKRHYGCLQCDSIFPSREVLECHREQMGHYNYDHYFYEGEDEVSDSDSFETDDDENGLGDYSEECDDEERERLL